MAKRKTNTAKRAERERETNAQRRAREERNLSITNMAAEITGMIAIIKNFGCSNSKPFASVKDCFAAAEACRIMTYANGIQNESKENIAKALRVAADMLEGKPEDGRTFSGQDKKIDEAYMEVIAREARKIDLIPRGHPNRVIHMDRAHLLSTAGPTFSEFLQVYRERNPRVKVEDRTLRRSLQRLGHSIRPDKRGPNGK